MSHISKILINNFQKHKRLLLNFSKGLNVIYGESDNGKSSIIRSLKWIISNRPLGDLYRTHGTDKTFVSIEKDNHIIKRRKSKNTNDYKIDDKTPYKATKSNVPDDVLSLLNLSEINVQSQHETYFLVHNSPGQRSKILNEVAGLEIMDNTLSLVNSKIRSANDQFRTKYSLLEEVKFSINGLIWAKNADKELEKLECINAEINEISKKISTISEIIQAINDIRERKNKLIPKSFFVELNKLILLKDEIFKLNTKKVRLGEILSKIVEFKKRQGEVVILDVSDLKNECIYIEKEQKRLTRIANIIEEIIEGEYDHTTMTERILNTEYEIKNELKRIGICPLCQNEIK